MTAREIVKHLMTLEKYSYATLTKKIEKRYGISLSRSNVYDRLNARENCGKGKHDMRVDTLLTYLEALDCELVIREKYERKGEKRQEWVVQSDSVGNKKTEAQEKEKSQEDRQDTTEKYFVSIPKVHAAEPTKPKTGRYSEE